MKTRRHSYRASLPAGLQELELEPVLIPDHLHDTTDVLRQLHTATAALPGLLRGAETRTPLAIIAILMIYLSEESIHQADPPSSSATTSNFRVPPNQLPILRPT